MTPRTVVELVVLVLLAASAWWWRTSGRRQEKARANARFRTLYAVMPVGVIEIDLDHTITHCNAGFAAMVGLSSDEVVGRQAWTLYHPDSAPPDVAAVEDLVAGRRTSYTTERSLRGPDGEAVPVQLDWGVAANDGHQPAHLVCVFTDISAQARAKTALQQARERAEVLWRHAPIGVIETTPDGVVTSVNDEVQRMLGHRAEDVVGTPAFDLLDPAYAPDVASAFPDLQAGTGYSAERRYLSTDGRSVPVYVSTAVLRDEAGEVSRLAAFVVDTTELTAQRDAVSAALADSAAVRDELARRQSFTDALLETVDVGIVACDAAGANMTRNRALRSMLGLGAGPADSVVGAADAAIHLLSPDGNLLEPGEYPLARALRGEGVQAMDLKVGPVGGPYGDVVVQGSRITAPDGTPAGAVVAVTDVTAERRAGRELALETARLKEAQRLGQLGSFTFDPRSGDFTFSEQIYRIWGVPLGADLASMRISLVHPDDVQQMISEWRAALATGGRFTSQYRIVRPDDEVRHLRVSFEVVLDPGGEPVEMNGTHLDVTEVTLAQRTAVEASALFQGILAATPDYTFVTDTATGAVVYGSPGKTILGITTEDLSELGPSLIATLVHPDEQPRLVAANRAAQDLADGEVLQLRYQARHVDGAWHWLSRRVTPFRRDETTGEVVQVLGVVRDVTDVVEAEQHLTYTALHDPLTGLPNRALLMDRLEAALGRSRQRGREVAILFCDLDGFKRVNDTAGHAAGDAVLLEAAARLQGVLRDGDTVSRVGGDEFVIVAEPWKRAGAGLVDDPVSQAWTPAQDRDFVCKIADRITQVMRRPVVVDGLEHVVTVSIGITYAGQSGATASSQTADTVLQDADAAMYRAKHGGKDRFEIFEHGLRTDLAERGRVEQVLRQALAPRSAAAFGCSPLTRPTLRAAYQPIVDGRTGALVGWEALARLTDADGRAIPPDVFINIAENTALIRPLGDVMLDLACAQLATWRRELPAMQDVTMAVNVSALQAQHSAWAQHVREVVAAHGLAAGDLVLELTETALLQAANSTLSDLTGLREEGVGIALDDFGTGYASLRYLATLPVSAVKVDRSFTCGLPGDRTSRTIVSAVANLAADLGLDCIVEGVETPEQRSCLPDGVQVQGYLVGRPLAAADIDVLGLLLVPAVGGRG